MAGESRQTGRGPSGGIDRRIDEIRHATFETARKGYDPRQVRRYLEALADWLGQLGLADPDRGEMRRELGWVGERTSEILTQAEETAVEMRQKAEAEAARMRAEATKDSERMRAEADDAARRTQLEATERAEATIADAERRAEELVEDANARRRDLQALIGDLLDRRDEIVAEGNRLVDDLADLFASAAAEDEEPEVAESEEGDELDELEAEDEDEDLGDAEDEMVYEDADDGVPAFDPDDTAVFEPVDSSEEPQDPQGTTGDSDAEEQPSSTR